MLRVGLTGGIASGKSTVADIFVGLGVALVDTDAIARELVAPGTEALAAVREAFGDDICDAAGELDRRKLRKRVFGDEGERRKLERILHPGIRRRALERLDRLDAERAVYVIVAVPLLLETDFRRLVDRVLVVDCPESVQLARLVARDGVSADEARTALGTQMDREHRLRAADDVVDNGGDIVATRAQVAQLHERYLELARNDPRSRSR